MATAKVIIAGQNNIGPAVKSAKSDLSGFEQTANKVSETLKKAFTVTAIVAAVKKLGNALSSCMNDFLTAQRAYKQLSIAIGDDSAYKSVSANIAKLSKQTLSSKGDIEAMVSELAGLGKSADEINAISDAAVYLSNVTGRDLSSSMTTLLNTYNGNITQLKKLGVDTSELTKKELEQGAAVQLVIDKFGTLSQEMAKADTSQRIQNIKNNIGDIKQAVGDLVSTTVSPVLARLESFTEKLKTDLDDLVQKVKVVFENLPEIWSRLMSAVKGGLSNFFSIEGIKQFLSNLTSIIVSRIKLIGDACANLASLVTDIAQETLKGIGNYAMYWITHITDTLGINLTDTVNSIGKWLTESQVGKAIDSILTSAANGIRLVMALVKNIPDMVKLVLDNLETIVSNLWISVKNGFFLTLSAITDSLYKTLDKINFPQLIENIKVSFSNIFGRVGSWFTAVGETAKDTFRYIGDILKVTFSWNSVKTIFTTLFKNIGVVASTVIKEIFVNIPSMISSVFQGVISWIGYAALHLKNEVHDALNSALDPFRKALNWLGISTNSGKADSSGEENLKAKADSAFSGIGSDFGRAVADAVDAASVIKDSSRAVSDLYEGIQGINIASSSYEELTAQIKESGAFVRTLENVTQALGSRIEDNSAAWEDIGEQFAALLDPVFEKFTSESSSSIGQTMAVWTAKNSDEYYKTAKKNFSNIGDFLKNWGETFLSDLGNDWQDVTSSFSSIFTDAFGNDFDAFLSWFRPFMEDKLGQKASDTAVDASSSGGGSSSALSEFGDNALNSLLSNLGQAGNLANNLIQNMSTLGPVLGAIATALEYIFEGFGESLGEALNLFVTYGVEPLRELGRVLGNLVLPILEAVMPIVKQSAELLVSLFHTLGVILQPVIEIIITALTPVLNIISAVLQALMPVIKVFAKVVVTITGTIQYVVQVLQHWIAVIMNWLAGLSIFGWHPFGGLRMNDPGSPGSYSSYIQGKWSEVDRAFETGTSTADSYAGLSTSTETAVSSASYRGATQVTINIYQQAPVVGDGGMRAFAEMIKSEFDALSYYGVTA